MYKYKNEFLYQKEDKLFDKNICLWTSLAKKISKC